MPKLRVLIFVVAFQAEKTIRDVLARIPAEIPGCDLEVLVIDDASPDRTFEQGREVERSHSLPFPLTVLTNPVNQGYGGNQKIGYHFAIENGFDAVALVHGDGQYAPERLPELLQPIIDGDAGAVFGSRMLTPGSALQGGMPLYKWLGNRILTRFQNSMLGTRLSEFHSGYRVYSVAALRKLPFHLNTNAFHFDTEIIIQLLRANVPIREVPIPTYYGDEISYVNGLRYAKDVATSTLVARAQDLGLFYRRNFDLRQERGGPYEPKLDFPSPHSMAVERVRSGDRVLDIGCADGFVSRALQAKGCHVTGLDVVDVDPAEAALDRFIRHDIDAERLPVDLSDFDWVLLLDVIEHLSSPERFVDQLREGAALNPQVTLLVSSGNAAFAPLRAMLALGQVNYGSRGILDMTHTRLFTFASLRRLFEQGGFRVDEAHGVPAPFPLALGDASRLGRGLVRLNDALTRTSKTLFGYQSFLVVRPQPALAYLLRDARRVSAVRERVGSRSPEREGSASPA